jgi:hypothetical protein
MKTNISYVVPLDHRPKWLVYPQPFLRIVEQGIIHITPWHILEADRAIVHHQGLTGRYPARQLFPFAYRQDNDDVACWSKDMGEEVFVIHDFASPGFENEGRYEDFWSWFRASIDETISWD